MQGPQRPAPILPPDLESSSVILKFPTIPVHGTPASWDSHSQLVTMTSTHDESGDDTTSSLGESSYDFIDDRSNVTTDDEDQDGMTESITSSDGHTFERVHGPSQGSGQSDHVGSDRQDSTTTRGHQQQKTASQSRPTKSGQCSDLREVNNSGFHDEHEPIEFDEPSITSLNSSRFTEVSHTLEIIEKPHRPNDFYSRLLDRLQGHLAITVRQTMTSHSLNPTNGQYKIMYVGDPAARDSIIQKIGTVLAATLNSCGPSSEKIRTSKFNIVPISAFGEKSSPDVVLIDSSGLELTVEDCKHGSFAKREDNNDSLCLELSNGTPINSVWNGSKFTVPDGWGLPDIAIFCIPNDEDCALRLTRQVARSFMSRHKVLSIVISQTSTWDEPPAEPMTLDYLTPHICIEARKSTIVNAQIIRRVPIDITTFLDIDAGQMNRNLACLAAAPGPSQNKQHDRLSPSEKAKGIFSANPWSFREVLESLVSDVQKDGLKGLNRYEYIAGLAVTLMSLLGMLAMGFGLMELLGASRVSNSRVFPTHASVLSTSSFTASTPTLSPAIPLSSISASSLAASLPSSTSTHVPLTKSPSTNTDIASFLLDAYMLAPNKSEQFKIHVLGDSHVVLRPPHWFSKLKKPPRLNFKITRGDREVQHRATTLFDGVYALQVSREDGYGMLNVEVWTESKPLVQERFEVDFGSSWLKVAGWRKATRTLTESIRGELCSVQTSLSTVYDHAKTGLSTFILQQRKKGAAQRSADRGFLVSRLKAATNTKQLIVAQGKDVQRAFCRGLFDTQIAASCHMSNRVERLTKHLTQFARNRTSVISRHANRLVRAATEADIGDFFGSLAEFRRRHLRDTQKRALKAWWTLKGVPKQKNLDGELQRCSPNGCEL